MANDRLPSAPSTCPFGMQLAKIAEKPLFQLLAERSGAGVPDPKVFVYAAGGYYYPGKNLEGLKREMRGYLDRGYTVVKMKRKLEE
jgi:L-alanine-DL-glutamate epimerase-like enolase superfamily enzyme